GRDRHQRVGRRALRPALDHDARRWPDAARARSTSPAQARRGRKRERPEAGGPPKPVASGRRLAAERMAWARATSASVVEEGPPHRAGLARAQDTTLRRWSRTARN